MIIVVISDELLIFAHTHTHTLYSHNLSLSFTMDFSLSWVEYYNALCTIYRIAIQ